MKKIIKKIRRIFNPKFPLDFNSLPSWVKKAHSIWYDKLPVRPYDKKVFFKGKNWIYVIIHGCGKQGECPIIEVYKQKKIT